MLRPNPPVLHDLVITAAHAHQAAGYRRQLARRRQTGQLPSETRTLVVTDPRGRRIGSGGSTLIVLHHLLRSLPARGSISERFAGRRIFIIHAGGDSKRLPAYAAQGKLFIDLPCLTPDGHPATLFDLFLGQLLNTPAPAAGQVLVASGDVLLTFDQAAVDWSSPSVTGVSCPGNVAQAAQHGVYVTDRKGRVRDFLQKPDEEALHRHHAFCSPGEVRLDTGLMSFDPGAVEALCHAAGINPRNAKPDRGSNLLADLLSGTAGEIDLYEEIALALASDVTLQDYEQRVLSKPRNAAPDQQTRLRKLYESIHSVPFRTQTLPQCEFLHLGKSRDLLAGLTRPSMASTVHGFSGLLHSIVPPGVPRQAIVCNSVIQGNVTWSTPALLEASHVNGPLELAGRNIVSNLPETLTRPVHLPPGIGLLMLPVGQGEEWSAVLYGLDDDRHPEPLGDTCSFLNAPLADFLRRHGFDPSDLWPRGERTLHRARLWCCGQPNDVLERTHWMLEESPSPKSVASWRAQRRLSMEELVRRVDHERFAAHRERLWQSYNVHQPWDWLARERRLDASRPAPRAAISPGQIIRATVPARLDFAGGWSDTPPICVEQGGEVVHAAVTLNGAHPIQASLRLTDEPVIHIESVDLGQRVTLDRVEQLLDHTNPTSWSSLPRACLCLAGLTFGKQQGDLRHLLPAFGGGIDLTLHSTLPQGSGLGTSSLLGSATLACLARLTGEKLPPARLVRRALWLEQVMTTGGGWQDPVGGIYPGVKYSTSEPGFTRNVHLRPLPWNAAWAREHLLLYYTGQARLAKNILQQVVHRYQSRDHELLALINRIKAGANAMRDCIQQRDWDSFGKRFLDYGRLKGQVVPSATTPAVEELTARVHRHCSGYGLLGAGGGGFLLMVARNQAAARRIRDDLAASPASPGAGFHDFAVADRGLQVRVSR